MFTPEETLGRLLGYCETWWQDPGYGGVYIHPSWNVTNLHHFGPHSMANAAAVCAFFTLFEKFGTQEWMDRSLECADLLVSLSRPSGVFRHSSGEYDPEEGNLLHNILPDIALLRLAAFLERERLHPRKVERYLEVVRRNIDWIVGYWWDGRYFCGTINQDLNALVAMALYEKIAGPAGFRPYIEAVIDYVERMVEPKDGPTAGAIRRSDEPWARVLATHYQAGKAVFLLELSELYEDERLLPLARGAADYVCRQQRPDGLFDWGYVEKDGVLTKKTYPLSTSLWIARCGKRLAPHIATFDWRAYLGLILKDMPLRVTATGFGDSGESDWRSRASSHENVTTLEFLAEVVEAEPVPVPFDGLVQSRGGDVLAGRGAFVIVESPRSLFRIAETPSPALDLVVSKKAEFPIVYPGLEWQPSFVVFSDDRPDEVWEFDGSLEDEGVYRYTVCGRSDGWDGTSGQGGTVGQEGGRPPGGTGAADSGGCRHKVVKERVFRFGRAAVEVIQTPHSGAAILFEANPRNSIINRLVTRVGGQIVMERFSRLSGEKETVIPFPEPWFTISNNSLRLACGDVKVSFSAGIERITIDHRSANPQGKLRVSVVTEKCDELVVTVEPGRFPVPGYKHIN